MNKRTKLLLTGVAAVGLLFLYGMIFLFSGEDASRSAARSERFTRCLVKFYYYLVGNGKSQTAGEVTGAVTTWDGRIRELAHFMEYLGVGFLSYGILLLWYHPIWRGRLIILIQLLLSAGMDEINQRFSPGRSASVEDVLVDTAGGVIGMGLIWLCFRGCKWLTGMINSDGRRSSPSS